eukprot:g10204.t1
MTSAPTSATPPNIETATLLQVPPRWRLAGDDAPVDGAVLHPLPPLLPQQSAVAAAAAVAGAVLPPLPSLLPQHAPVAAAAVA